MITSKITAENLNTPIRGKHGDRARRSLTHWKPWDRFKPCVVESSTKVAVVESVNEDGSVPFHYSSNQLDYDTHRWVAVPDVAKVETKTTKKPGSRKNKLPPTLNQGPIFSMYDIVPACLVPLRKKVDSDDKADTVGFDEDGCVRIRVSDPVSNRKNKHTVNPDDFNKPSGPMLSKAKSVLGMYGKRADTLPSICDNSKYVLVDIKLTKTGTKFYQATCKCRNAEAKLSKTIIIPRVRNKVQAQARLTAVHGITE